jgi:hypothetical protein
MKDINPPSLTAQAQASLGDLAEAAKAAHGRRMRARREGLCRR